MTDFFDKLVWQPDRVLLDDLVFRLERDNDDTKWELGDNCFVFYKGKPLVNEYAYFFLHPDFQPKQVVELGLWKGVVFLWFELFQPDKHVGIELGSNKENAYYQNYLANRHLQERVRLYWDTDQGDKPALQEIISREFKGPLDLIIDDASHQYVPSRSSFETLFPLLRPGGLYIIEDWAWPYWRGFEDWPGDQLLSRLAFEAAEIAASGEPANRLVQNIFISRLFVIIERGSLEVVDPANFKLEDYIYRHPTLVAQQPARMQARLEYLEKGMEELQTGNSELHQYIKKLEVDRENQIEKLGKLQQNLHALELTRSVRVSRKLGSLLQKLRVRK